MDHLTRANPASRFLSARETATGSLKNFILFDEEEDSNNILDVKYQHVGRITMASTPDPNIANELERIKSNEDEDSNRLTTVRTIGRFKLRGKTDDLPQ